MDIKSAIQTLDHAAHQDDRWIFVALLLVGMVTMYFFARYFMREIADLQREIVSVRSDFDDVRISCFQSP